MSGALDSVMSTVGNLVGEVAGAAIQVAFPEVSIISSALNLVGGALGKGIEGAVDGLTKELGMPSFLADPIKDLIHDAIGGAFGGGKGAEPECTGQIEHACHNDLADFASQICKSLMEETKNNVEGEEGGGSKSWLVALAKAMGGIASKHADKMTELSKKMDAAGTGEGGGPSKDFMQAQSEFQAESQLFNMLQSAFTNAIKTLGEGLGQMARKG